MKRRTALIFYVLSAYVVIQFVWWGFHLIHLTRELAAEKKAIGGTVSMVIGEGAVFLLILLLGMWQIRRAVQRDLKLSERQHNFLLSVTHELKTPLAANKLYLQTLEKRKLSKDQQAEILQRALLENDRLERMIDNILNASRLESNAVVLNTVSTNLHTLLHQCAERFFVLAPEATFELNIPENCVIKADPMLLESVINNIIENALKYGGQSAKINMWVEESAGKCSIHIQDDGPGISEADQSEVFQKFYRAGNEDTRTQKGSGLGLFIVSELVKLHGGCVRCLPSEKGAHFLIELNNGN